MAAAVAGTLRLAVRRALREEALGARAAQLGAWAAAHPGAARAADLVEGVGQRGPPGTRGAGSSAAGGRPRGRQAAAGAAAARAGWSCAQAMIFFEPWIAVPSSVTSSGTQ